MQTPMKEAELNINPPNSMQMMNAQEGLQTTLFDVGEAGSGDEDTELLRDER